ncbi:ABC transporter permease [Rhodococcus sp. BP-349]|uniref:ABC transporter permease n=1 Tax=unclassified Rhodococcus (in: high G+C Gram-positive bacteria) TaxID=192944 RepID=UPI001C9A5203|nr:MULTISPECIES: ABC transporter permease [unclassified Rhodococcus (in: high G+C Gram-positive bacteria)]MBY6538121.1 ABC transporter permease [Rhodococcus sp. BP-363]MBY6542458.1 ABC transporter permease [Rhodococcus sp. BP-369]MBY6561688.1 ABC transporter permease [Rhodococcus sp. BP-370]MBY6575980.1 ABC transporter permease [Rhodococcus sp. BP-364]MBY6585281.1 ABC transporter permease [Rhodococcus sp. BP-358]
MTSFAVAFAARDGYLRESSVASLVRGSGLQCSRILVKWLRDPVTLAQALLYPALMVLLFWLVLDRSVSQATGTSPVTGMVPMVALVGAMSGASISGIGLQRERDNGQLAKMWVLPAHRASAMVGRLCAELVRVAVTVSLILAVGVIVGFRVTTGPVGLAGVLIIALVFGTSFSIMVTALALRGSKTKVVEWTAVGTNVALFFNSGFVPVASYPAWLQPIIRWQPLSCAVDAMRGVATGTSVAQPLLATAAWSIGILAVFAVPAVRGYRRASQT